MTQQQISDLIFNVVIGLPHDTDISTQQVEALCDQLAGQICAEPDEIWWGYLEIELGVLEDVARRIREGTLYNNEAIEIQQAVGKIRVATREARAYLPAGSEPETAGE